MKPFLKSSRLIVKPSSIKGYGVFADEDIYPGQIIEECYVLTMPKDEVVLHAFHFGLNEQENALPLGFGCIYNHSNQPNACYSVDPEEKIMTYTARERIKKGDEIFIYYGDEWFTGRSLPVIETSRLRLWWRKYLGCAMPVLTFQQRALLLVIAIILCGYFVSKF